MDEKLLQREQTLLSMLYEKNTIIQALVAQNKKLQEENNALREVKDDMANKSSDQN